MKSISETKPSTTQYVVEWVFFALVSLLPLMLALVLLSVAPTRPCGARSARAWLERHGRTVFLVLLTLLAASLLRNGIAGLTS